MIFTVKNQNIIFHAKFYGKYSVICGDSAIGKTVLYRFLYEAEEGTVGYEIDIDVPYHVLDRRTTERDIAAYEDTLLVLDENCKILHLPNTPEILKRSKNRFLIISRKVPSFLPLGIKNLYTLRNNEELYCLEQVYPRYNKRVFSNIDKIITEDSDAGLAYFTENFNVKCESSQGNGNLESNLRNVQADSSTLVVFDSAGIIPVAKRLYRYITRHNVQVLDWDSFESYILTQPAISQEIDYDDTTGESIEQISAHKLSILLNYTKSDLPDCLIYSKGCNNCYSGCSYNGNHFSTDICISSKFERVEKLSIF